MKNTHFCIRFVLAMVSIYLSELVVADQTGKNNVTPYKLIEGRQYDICNALLPVVNSVSHGSLRDDPSLLTKAKDVKLPNWELVKDKKYIDLYLNEARSPQEFSKERYPENYANVTQAIDKDEMRFYVAHIDVDNTGVARPVLRQDNIKDGKVYGVYYRFSYFVYDEAAMEPSKQYQDLIDGVAIYYKSRTFSFSEWAVGGDVNRWKIGVMEPYYDSSRSQLKSPPKKTICVFSIKSGSGSAVASHFDFVNASSWRIQGLSSLTYNGTIDGGAGNDSVDDLLLAA